MPSSSNGSTTFSTADSAGPSRAGDPAMGVVYAVLGSTFAAMRVAARDLPPLVMSGARLLLAGLAVYAWCARRRRRTSQWKPPT